MEKKIREKNEKENMLHQNTGVAVGVAVAVEVNAHWGQWRHKTGVKTKVKSDMNERHVKKRMQDRDNNWTGSQP